MSIQYLFWLWGWILNGFSCNEISSPHWNKWSKGPMPFDLGAKWLNVKITMPDWLWTSPGSVSTYLVLVPLTLIYFIKQVLIFLNILKIQPGLQGTCPLSISMFLYFSTHFWSIQTVFHLNCFFLTIFDRLRAVLRFRGSLRKFAEVLQKPLKWIAIAPILQEIE